MRISLMFLGTSLILLAGCATVKPLGSGPTTIRVVTFALSHTVTLDSSGGKAEMRPALLGGDQGEFDAPLRAAIEQLWVAFPESADRLTTRGPWVGPVQSLHATYRTLGNEEMNPNTPIIPPPRSRGFLWPTQFRFLEPLPSVVEALGSEFPGEYLLLVEYRAFVQNVGEDTAFTKAGFRMGMVATMTLYGPDGELHARDTITGFSDDTAERRGIRLDRSAYPSLLLQAQEDILRQWARRPVFRTER